MHRAACYSTECLLSFVRHHIVWHPLAVLSDFYSFCWSILLFQVSTEVLHKWCEGDLNTWIISFSLGLASSVLVVAAASQWPANLPSLFLALFRLFRLDKHTHRLVTYIRFLARDWHLLACSTHINQFVFA